MSSYGKELTPFTCPICSLLGEPDKMVKDPRWDDPVHPECVRKLSEWPKYARNPLGRFGDDVYHEPRKEEEE